MSPAPKEEEKPGGAVAAGKSVEDDPWASIAVGVPKTSSKPLSGSKTSPAVDQGDPWASIAVEAPKAKVRPLALGRGAKAKAAVPTKLGAQRIDRNSSGI